MGRTTIESGWYVVYFGLKQNQRFHLSENAVVYAWPSTGGRLELQNPSAFELDLLGIEDHLTESNKSANVSEEDAFALRLRRLGGTFFKYKYGSRYGDVKLDADHTFLGWPEDERHRGGVWVLTLRWGDMLNCDKKTMTGRIRLARIGEDDAGPLPSD